MINRVLIRIKVVQLLYSYLLTEKHFSIEPSPSQPTKEKRFAYKIYLDTLALMIEITRELGKRSKMSENRFIAALSATDVIKAIITKGQRGERFEFRNMVAETTEKIKSSGIYKLYTKKSAEDSLSLDVKVWKEIFEHILWTDPLYNKVAASYENYSLRGMDRMREMMEDTFANFMTSHGGIQEAIRQLDTSMNAARELYFRLLLLPVAIADLRNRMIEEGRAKHLPTAEDINPDMRLTEAPLLQAVRENMQIHEFAEKHDIDWEAENPQLIAKLLKAVLESESYAQYKTEEVSMTADYNFYRNVFSEVILNNETFLEDMESKSVFWNDDIDIMAEFAIKTYRRFEEGMGQNAVLAMYKDEADRNFGKELFKAVINNKENYRAIMDSCLDTKVWETERLAYMDVIIMLTAMAEMLNFPSIPLKVTLNEYIEIAKSYSTAKSGMFINGLLGVIIAKLQREGLLMKTNADVRNIKKQ